MNRILKKIVIAVVAILMLVGIDQWTKFLAVAKLQTSVELIK